MPVFISYSHSDASIANKIAVNLVKHNANVWVDKWELNVGDSIINKIQEAIRQSSALLVILSKASVESEWCKKEISAGLMRELNEKRSIILPTLIEDCEIPPFLQEKMYADLRTDFDSGFQEILDAIAKVTNADQGRFEKNDHTVDWSEDWGYDEDLFYLRFSVVCMPRDQPMSILIQINISCDEAMTKKYKQYDEINLGWFGRNVIASILFDASEREDIKFELYDQHPKKLEMTIEDTKIHSKCKVTYETRRMGEDNGKNQLVNVSGYLEEIKEHVLSVSREPTPEEVRKLYEIIANPTNS